jgi:hypothetical protein
MSVQSSAFLRPEMGRNVTHVTQRYKAAESCAESHTNLSVPAKGGAERTRSHLQSADSSAPGMYDELQSCAAGTKRWQCGGSAWVCEVELAGARYAQRLEAVAEGAHWGAGERRERQIRAANSEQASPRREI